VRAGARIQGDLEPAQIDALQNNRLGDDRKHMPVWTFRPMCCGAARGSAPIGTSFGANPRNPARQADSTAQAKLGLLGDCVFGPRCYHDYHCLGDGNLI